MSLWSRALGALRMDAAVYDEIGRDPRALGQSLAIVALAGLARGAGPFAEAGLAALIAGLLVSLVIWLSASGALWAIGLTAFDSAASVRAVLSSVGFAAVPLVGLVLRALPLGPLDRPFWIAVHGAALLALMIAARQSLGLSTTRALFVCMLALAASLVALFVVSLLLPARSFAAV